MITSGLMTCALGVLDDRMRELNMPGLTVGTAIMIGILVAVRFLKLKSSISLLYLWLIKEIENSLQNFKLNDKE